MSADRESGIEGGTPAEQRVLAIYRAASTDVPSAHIDAAIRAAAYRAVGSRPRPLGGFRLETWRAPLALAATVVLSATAVYWNVREQGIEKLSAPVQTQRPDVPREAPAAAGPSQEKDVVSVDTLRAAKPSVLYDRAAAPPAKSASSKGEPKRGRLAGQSEDMKKSLLLAPAQTPAAEGATLQETITLEAKPLSPSAAPAAAAPELSPPPAPAKDMETQRRENLQTEHRAADQLLRSEKSKRAASAAPAQISSTTDVASSRAEEIRTLIRDGKHRQALEGIAQLRRDYPDFTVPEDIVRFAKEAESANR